MITKTLATVALMAAPLALQAHSDHESEKSSKPQAPAANLPDGALTGQGDWVYKTVHDWGRIPGQEYIGSTHGGVAVDNSGKIYVSTDGPNGIIVYQPDGTFLKSWGEPSRRFHSLVHRVENGKEFLYAAGGDRVCKLDLDGNIVLSIEHKEGSEDRPWKKATAADVAPDGTIYVADGYGTNLIYKYSQDGKFLGKFGAPGTEPGKFRTCHGLTIDDRDPSRPLLVVCDRENLRIQLLDLNGNPIAIPITDLRRPCATAMRGDLILVAELAGRAVLLDKDYKILSILGDNPVTLGKQRHVLWRKIEHQIVKALPKRLAG